MDKELLHQLETPCVVLDTRMAEENIKKRQPVMPAASSCARISKPIKCRCLPKCSWQPGPMA